MKTFAAIVVLSLGVLACRQERISKEENKSIGTDRIDRLLDFVLEQKDQSTIELPFLYDSLCSEMPSDGDERILLAQRLKQRGFKVVNWGRGNFAPKGHRIVVLTLKKGNCYCDVSKIYYHTVSDSLLEMTERISCGNKLE